MTEKGKRLVFTAPFESAWQEFEVPERPGPFQVIVRTHKSLISAGTELAVASGTHRGFSLPQPGFAGYPHVPGYALVGEIIASSGEAGQLDPGFKVGARVFVKASHASHVVVDARRGALIPLPPRASDHQALLARLASISMVGVRAGRIAPGDRVAVLGLGLIGQLAAQLARACGARPVVGIDRNASRRDAAGQTGVTAIPLAEGDPGSIKNQLRVPGFDVVIEASGNPASLPYALQLVARGGRVVLLGSARGTVEIDPYTFIHKPGIHVIGAHESNAPGQETPQARWTMKRNYELCLDQFIDGTLADAPLVSHIVPVADAGGIHREMYGASGRYLGVVIDWRNSASGA